MDYKFDHIGIKVSSLDRALETVPCFERIEAPQVGLSIALIKNGGVNIELLEIVDPDNPLMQQLKQQVSHIGFYTKDIQRSYEQLSANPRIAICTPIMRGLHGRRVFFYRVKERDNLLYELVSGG